MILYLLYQSAVWGGLLIFALIAMVIYKHFKAMDKVKYFVDQGFFAVPGHDAFVIGNISNIMEYAKVKQVA